MAVTSKCLSVVLLIIVTIATAEAMKIKGCKLVRTNNEAEGFSTDASHDAPNADLALLGTGRSWNPSIQSSVFWFAGVSDKSGCVLRTVQFSVRFAARVKINAAEFGSDIFNTVEVIQKPNNFIPEQFIVTKTIKLPANIQRIQIVIVPTTEFFNTPQLRKVVIRTCCDDAVPCTNVKVNKKVAGLKLSASMRNKFASKALPGKGGWSPQSTEISYWTAMTTKGVCGMYSIYFEVQKAWDVIIKVKRAGGEFKKFKELAADPSNPGGLMPWNSGQVILDKKPEDGPPIEAVELTIYAGMKDFVLQPATLYNVRITFCCDPTKPPPPTPPTKPPTPPTKPPSPPTKPPTPPTKPPTPPNKPPTPPTKPPTPPTKPPTPPTKPPTPPTKPPTPPTKPPTPPTKPPTPPTKPPTPPTKPPTPPTKPPTPPTKPPTPPTKPPTPPTKPPTKPPHKPPPSSSSSDDDSSSSSDDSDSRYYDHSSDSSDKSHGDSSDKSHGDSSDKSHGDSSGKSHGDSSDKSHSGSSDKSHGGSSDKSHGGSSDKSHGGSSDKSHGDSSDDGYNGYHGYGWHPYRDDSSD